MMAIPLTGRHVRMVATLPKPFRKRLIPNLFPHAMDHVLGSPPERDALLGRAVDRFEALLLDRPPLDG